MHNTVAMPSYDLSNQYDNIMQTLNTNGQVFVTRDGKEEAVMIKAEDFAAFEEYLHTKYVCGELEKAEAYAADPNAKWISSDDFFKETWALVEAKEREQSVSVNSAS